MNSGSFGLVVGAVLTQRPEQAECAPSHLHVTLDEAVDRGFQPPRGPQPQHVPQVSGQDRGVVRRWMPDRLNTQARS